MMKNTLAVVESVPLARLGMYLSVVLLMSTVVTPVAAADAPNPVRRVITMLQMMQSRVEEEDQHQQALFDKSLCFCQTNLQKLDADIDIGKTTVPELENNVKEAAAEKADLGNRIVEATAEHADASKTLEEATSIRNKENTDFKDLDSQKKVDIGSLKGAVAAMDRLSDGGGGFVQMGTSLTASIRRLVSTSTDLSTSDRDVVASFLSEADSNRDETSDSMSASSPAEITGILKQMEQTMADEKVQLNKDENAAVKQFESLKTDKESQMSTLAAEIQGKTERVGRVGMQMVQDQQKLEETQNALEASEKLQGSMSKECKARKEEYNTQAQTRSEELLAIAGTVRILNDDAAAHLFRKSLPAGAAASLLQTQASPNQLKGDAIEVLRRAIANRKNDPRIDFLALALRSKKTSFTEVLNMIDNMIALLNKEQQNDVDKKQYCESEMAETDDDKKKLNQGISDFQKDIKQTEQKLQAVNADIEGKEESILALDKQVADATKQRRQEHRDYTEDLAANSAAKKILAVAKARLGQFYKIQQFLQIKRQPKIHGKPLENNQLSISAPFDDDALSFVQMWAEADTTYTAAKKKKDGSTVIALIDTITADIDKQVEEMGSSEKDTQLDYEQAIKDCAEKRAGEAKAVGELEGVKAAAERDRHKTAGSIKAKTVESIGKASYLEDLKKQCDSLLQRFEALRMARTNEIDALQKAKAVLTSSDANFFQVSKKTLRGSHPRQTHV